MSLRAKRSNLKTQNRDCHSRFQLLRNDNSSVFYRANSKLNPSTLLRVDGEQCRTIKTAFSLVESVTALVILALVSSSVLVIIDRNISAAADSAQRLAALEIARENMETLLSKESVKEVVEFGTAENNPEIQWSTVVESFYEPATDRMWIQATCSAEYTDSDGETQTVELTHWLTDLTKKQLKQMVEQKQREMKWLASSAAANTNGSGVPVNPVDPVPEIEPRPETPEPIVEPESDIPWNLPIGELIQWLRDNGYFN
ncbi:MAG: hypothetical protein KAS69_06570 [Planctomycetes bacterium]|nr:hypothetical protein [Planctomycetota bacterium]